MSADMTLDRWAKQITTEISDAIGLGSEMFVRHGDIYRIDPTFVAQYIRERRKDNHEAMHRNVSRIRELEAKLAALSPPHPHSSNSYPKEADVSSMKAFPDVQGPPNEFNEGMDLRDWFAGQALGSGIIDGENLSDRQLSELFGPDKINIREEEIAAAIAYMIADAMIARRKAGAA